MGKIFAIGLCVALVVMMLFLIYQIVYACVQRKVRKWFKDKSNELSSEFAKIDHYLIEREYTHLGTKYQGYIISTQSNYKTEDRTEQTHPLSPWKIREIIFRIYDEPYDEVLEEYFMEYQNKMNAIIEKENKDLFSGNKYKRAVKFKTPEKDDE